MYCDRHWNLHVWNLPQKKRGKSSCHREEEEEEVCRRRRKSGIIGMYAVGMQAGYGYMAFKPPAAPAQHLDRMSTSSLLWYISTIHCIYYIHIYMAELFVYVCDTIPDGHGPLWEKRGEKNGKGVNSLIFSHSRPCRQPRPGCAWRKSTLVFRSPIIWFPRFTLPVPLVAASDCGCPHDITL